MKQYRGTVTWMSLLALVIACGDRQTIASKSAAAYAEAQKNGVAVSEGHEEHTATTATDVPTDHAMTGMEHSTMTAADHSSMAGMDHSKSSATDHSTMTTMDHSTMSATEHSAMTGMNHPTSAADHASMTGTDHSKMSTSDHSNTASTEHSMSGMDQSSTPGMDHSEKRRQAAALQGPLKLDEFDAPAATAVAEAQKAAESYSMEGHSMNGEQQETADLYTCTMHPEVISPTPGKCPKCGMTLVRKNNGANE